jgi:BioD-like phosphotransacetylase family protein
LVSWHSLSGKTALASGLAQGFARQGAQVRLVRSGAGPAAIADAVTFAGFLFASSTGQPASGAPSPAPGETVLHENDAAAAPTSSRNAALLVVRRSVTDEAIALGRALGDRLIGSIATDVAPAAVESVARDLTNGDLRPLAVIPEDRVLAAPCVAEIRDTLQAEVIYEGENDLEVVEDVLIAPVYADPAQPHFRRFASKAVLAPFNKTDLHLAAIETQAACLVITGGGRPSPYVADRARGEATTVLLAREETPLALASLGDVWSTSRFRGERKAAAILHHLESRLDFAGLRRRLEG